MIRSAHLAWHMAAAVILLLTLSGSSVRSVADAAAPVLEAAQTPARQITVPVHEGTSMAIALSPDRQTLALDLQGSIWIMPAAGGTAKRITDELYDARQPAWAPDGKSIAFQSFREGDWDIWSIAPDGSGAKKLTSGPFDDREPHYSHDGARIAFSSDRSGNYDIWDLDLKTGQLRQLTKTPGNDYMPAWSPDDREIAFASDRQGAPGVYAVTQAGVERLVAAAKGQVNAPSWGPGGDVLYNVIADDESQLFFKGQAITPGENPFPFRAQWLSGSEFLYVADGKIKKRSLSNPKPQVIEFTATFSFPAASYARKRRNFDSREPRQALGIVKPAVSPDGKKVAFAALGDLWILTIGGRADRITNDRFMEMDPGWSSDGSQLVFSSDRAGSMDLWIRDMKTGADRRLTEMPGSEMAGAFSPDGRQVAFVSNVGLMTAEIFTVDVKTRATRKVHDTIFGPSDPAWSADGQHLMMAALRRYSTRFREGINEFVTFPAAGGADKSFVPTPHRSSDSRTGGGPVWSPDGRKIAFVMEGVLNVMDVSPAGEPAGAPRKIGTEIAHDPSWTGDSQQLVYLSNDRLKMVPAAGGASKDLGLDLKFSQKIPTGRIVVHAGHLIDGRATAARQNVDIVVEGNRIRSVGPHRADLHTGTVVDASNLTVLPGLIEMHGHMLKEYGEAMGRAWLAYGITTVRNPAAMTPYMSLEDREAVEAGTRPGPRVFPSGYQMDGTRIYYPLGLSISSAAQLEMELERTKRLDLDLIKTYVRLPDTFQKRVIEFGHAMGIPVTSHEIYPAVAFGADGTEHTSGTSRRGYSPKMTAGNHTYEDVIQLMAKSGMFYTPTASLGGGYQLLTQKDPTMLDDPRFRILFPPWVTNPPASGRGGFGAPRESSVKNTGNIVLAASKAGVKILTGTDSPITPYGLSLQSELVCLVDAGMTPMQVIQAATVNAAEELAASADLGTVENGKLADFIMVDGDPLADIRNARKVRKVVKNGELFEFETLIRKGTN